MSYAALAAGITATAATGQTIAGGVMGHKARKLARELNESNQNFAREQNQWNLDMWNKTNEYNTPAHQRQLLEEAGYNPLLFTPEGSQAAMVESADLANQQYQDTSAYDNMVGSGIANIGAAGQYLNDATLRKKQVDAEVEHLQNQDEEIKANTKLIEANTGLSHNLAKKAAKELDLVNVQMDNYRAGTDYLKKQGVQIDFNMKLSEKQYDLQKQKVDADVKKVFSDIKVNNATIDKISEEINVLTKNAMETDKKIEVMELDRLMKVIEKDFKERNMEQEYRQNESKIFSALTSSMSTAAAALGKAYEEQSIEKFNKAMISGDWSDINTKGIKSPNNLRSGPNRAFGYTNGNGTSRMQY